jgi:hypothetical protein
MEEVMEEVKEEVMVGRKVNDAVVVDLTLPRPQIDGL